MHFLISDTALQLVERGILGLLLAMGVACIAIFVMRWRAVGLAGAQAGPVGDSLKLGLADDPTHGARSTAGSVSGALPGPADRILRLGLSNSHLCPEALDKLLETQEIREREQLERGAQFLGTVGANAPFLGLTGTVLGILSAFRRMADQGGSGGVEVMSAIAGALIATAIGLMVAIPAVVLYNVLRARIRRSMNALKEIRSLLLARSLQASAKEIF